MKYMLYYGKPSEHELYKPRFELQNLVLKLQNSKTKSPGSATITNRSQPLTPRGTIIVCVWLIDAPFENLNRGLNTYCAHFLLKPGLNFLNWVSLWLSLSGHYRVTDEALLAETT